MVNALTDLANNWQPHLMVTQAKYPKQSYIDHNKNINKQQ